MRIDRHTEAFVMTELPNSDAMSDATSDAISAPEADEVAFPSPGTRNIDEEARERKRVAIGLSARRATAPSAVHRPPRDLFSRGQRWLLTLLLVGLFISTALLSYAKVTGAPTSWQTVTTYWRSVLSGRQWSSSIGAYSPGPNYRLRLSDEFNTRTGLIACTQQAGEWSSDVVVDRGIYRMQVWPGRLTWSTIALNGNMTGDITDNIPSRSPYRIDASVTIVDMMPTGYTGFIGRYQDPSNFYLFMVDGLARYQIQLWHEGVLSTLQPWTANPLLNPAGYENIIALEDSGTELRFVANGSPLAILTAPVLPAGEVGLLGGAGERSMAEINVDWLRLYELAP